MRLHTGQVSIPVAIIALIASIALPTAGGYFAQSNRTDTKIGEVDRRVSALDTNQAVTTNDVMTLKENIKEIKDDLKDIKRALGVQ